MNYLYTVISGYSNYKISNLAILYRGGLFLTQRIQDSTITFSSTFAGQGSDAFYIYTMCIGAGDTAYYQVSYRENGSFHYIDQTTDSQRTIYVYGTP